MSAKVSAITSKARALPKLVDQESLDMARDISRASRLNFKQFKVELKPGRTVFDIVAAFKKVRKAQQATYARIGVVAWETEVAMLAACLVGILRPLRPSRSKISLPKRHK